MQFVDQARITGESLPVEKLADSGVLAGSINQSGALEIRAERVGRDTGFGKIIEAVEQAERSRAPVQRLADRLAGYLVYFALGAAVVTWVLTRDIRSTIFELQHAHSGSLRADVRGVVKEYVPTLGFTPLVRTTGPLDSAVPQEIAEQVLAVLREALSNVARHARADAAVVEVEAGPDKLMLAVTDNGTGLPEARDESGLRNVRRRASEHGGVVEMGPEEPSGTRLEWSVPLRG